MMTEIPPPVSPPDPPDFITPPLPEPQVAPFPVYVWTMLRVYWTRWFPPRCLWRCVREGGGGVLITPRPMSAERATAWVARVTNGEVMYVHHEYRHIFYRSRN